MGHVEDNMYRMTHLSANSSTADFGLRVHRGDESVDIEILFNASERDTLHTLAQQAGTGFKEYLEENYSNFCDGFPGDSTRRGVIFEKLKSLMAL